MGLLELELQTVTSHHGCWEPNPGPLHEQLVSEQLRGLLGMCFVCLFIVFEELELEPRSSHMIGQDCATKLLALCCKNT